MGEGRDTDPGDGKSLVRHQNASMQSLAADNRTAKARKPDPVGWKRRTRSLEGDGPPLRLRANEHPSLSCLSIYRQRSQALSPSTVSSLFVLGMPTIDGARHRSSPLLLPPLVARPVPLLSREPSSFVSLDPLSWTFSREPSPLEPPASTSHRSPRPPSSLLCPSLQQRHWRLPLSAVVGETTGLQRNHRIFPHCVCSLHVRADARGRPSRRRASSAPAYIHCLSEPARALFSLPACRRTTPFRD